MMRIYESILDDLENNASGEAVKKLRDETLLKSKDDYDFKIEVRMKPLSLSVDTYTADLARMRERVNDFMESCPSVKDYSDIDVFYSNFDITKTLLRNVHRALYRRKTSEQEYEFGLEMEASFSFRRPLNVLYFFGQLYNALNIPNMASTSAKSIKLYEVLLIKKGTSLKMALLPDILKYLSENRHEKIWPNVTYDTQRTIIKIANYMKPCLAAYTEVAKKLDMLNFNETSFAAEIFNKAAYNLNEKFVIPGHLYVQMQDAELSLDKDLDFGKLNYFYHNLMDENIKNVGLGEWGPHMPIREWELRTFFDELSERPRKPYMICAHAYKNMDDNIYFHIFVTFDPFYDEQSQTPYLFAIDYSSSGYILDEEHINLFAYNLCHNIFNGRVQMSDFIKFVKEKMSKNYAKPNSK